MNDTTKTIIGAIVIVAIVIGLGFALRRHPAPAPVSSVQNTAPATVATTASASASTTSMDQQYTQATFDTSMGSFTIAFDPSMAPNTVANFIKLASSGFYNGVKFHRVIAGFMIQGGDPLSKDDSQMSLWGTGGPGYQFNDEITPESKNVVGAVAMANSGPNTNGSQFFINVADNSYLDGHYTVFAHVTSGYDVVLAISKVPTDSSDRPDTPVVINSITLK